MAYQNISFPTIKLVHGFTVETESPTVVVTNFAKEYRIKRFSQEKQKYIFPGRNLAYADWLTIKSFFDTVGWQRDSFNLTIPGGVLVTKVRLDSLPTVTFVALNNSNVPTMVSISDIILKQVFNE
jgi:hypothetical protein